MKKSITTVLMIIIICLLLIIICLLVTGYGGNGGMAKETQEDINVASMDDGKDDEADVDIDGSSDDEKTDEEEKEDEAEIARLSGISKKEAIEKVLADAGLENNDLIFLTAYVTKYKGDFAYHVKFKTSGNYTMYDYVINAMTGNIEIKEKH